MSGIFGGPTLKGNRLTDFANTTATIGTSIPFGFGKFPVDGNIIWATLPPKETRSVQKQGKGGAKQEVFTYTMSYSVAFCRGPIFGYLWIKRNGKVVYTTDPAAPVEDVAYAAKWLEKATLYYGTADQLPDSTIEAFEGVGEVSGFRFIAHIVVEDDDVTDNGGAAPTYEACVIAGGIGYVTSPPYNIESGPESYRRTGALESGELRTIIIDYDSGVDGYSREGVLVSGNLKNSVYEYTTEVDDYRREGELVSGQLRTVVREQTQLAESYTRVGELISGTLETVVVEYTAPVEGYTRVGALIGGSLV